MKPTPQPTPNVLQRAAQANARFTEQMADCGYKVFTTFYADLTIAEQYGPAGIRETFDRVNNEWRGNVKYYTEFVLALNRKIWEHYHDNEPLARVYNELWEQADIWAGENYAGDDLQYYLRTTD